MLSVEFVLNCVLEVFLSPLGVYVRNFYCERGVEEYRDLRYLPGFHKVRDLVQHELCTFYGKSRNEYRPSPRNGRFQSLSHLIHSSLLGVYPIAIHALHDEHVSVRYGFGIGKKGRRGVSNIACDSECRVVFGLDTYACGPEYVPSLAKHARKSRCSFPLLSVLDGLHTGHEGFYIILVV